LRAVVQRVKKASVFVSGEKVSSIGNGLLVLVGIANDDIEKDIRYIVDKCTQLRIFDDDSGVMNKSAIDVGCEILVVSQFTLYGDARKGRRPNYINAANSSVSFPLYAQLIRCFNESGLKIQTGVFGAEMDVSLVNDGPVTILLDSRKVF